MPKVSVVIPTYNRKVLLCQALESVFAQSYRDYEVIVVDDGSTDGTEKALRPLLERIRYVAKPNGGPASARNRGIKEARGDYIAFLDSDDLWETKFLEVTCAYLERHGEIAMVATAWRTLPEGKRRPRIAASRLHGDLFGRLMERRFVRTSSVVARRDFLDQVGGFDEELAVAEDYDMWLRIARAFPVAFLNVPLSRGRKHSGNLSGDRLLGRLKELQVLETHYDAARVPARVYNKVRSHAYISAGRCYMKLGRLGDARACFEQALALTPYRLRPRRYLWKARRRDRGWKRSDAGPLHRVAIGSVSWLMPEMEPALGQSLSQFPWHRSTVLRATPGRRVLLLNGPRPLLIKHFYHRNLAAVVEVLFRGTPAARQWRRIRRAVEIGIATAKPLAVGQTGRIMPRESVLVTELLKEALPVDAYLFGPGRANGSERRRAIQEVAGLIRKAHDAGWRQRDFHLGNILITPESTAREIFLIDFQRAEFLRRPADHLRWRDLAVLHGGSTAASRSDRLRFLKEYLSAAPRLSVDLRTIAAQLERRGLRYRFKLWRRRGKRSLADNREFVRIRQGGYCGSARRADWAAELQGLLKIASAGINGGEIIKDSRTTTVAALQITENKIYVKRYNYQGWTYALKDLLRRARARRVWLAANGCFMRGLRVAPPLAYLERRRFGILLESYLVTGGVPGQTLVSWLARHGGDFRLRRALGGTLARFVARMHERRVQNRDLKFDNLIVVQKAPNSYGLFMVDFDGVAIGPISWRARMKNIAKLEREFRRSKLVTRTDRLRFLKTYLGPQFEERWKRCWRAVARRAGVD